MVNVQLFAFSEWLRDNLYGGAYIYTSPTQSQRKLRQILFRKGIMSEDSHIIYVHVTSRMSEWKSYDRSI